MKISYHSHIGGLDLSQGYGTAGFGIVTALKKLGFDVPFNDPQADVLLNFTQPPYYQFHGTDQYNIGYTPWESSMVDPGWIGPMEAVDEMWTTSPLIARWFGEAGCKRDIKVFEHGIDHRWTKRFRKPHRTVKFLHVGSDATRKGGQIAFDAFVDAFGKNNSSVSLTFKTHAAYTMIRREVAPGLLMRPQDYSTNVHHIHGDYPLDKLISLFHNYDVLIYPSYGEGFGLIPLQALATGMPTIQTSTWAPYNRFVIPELNVGDLEVDSPWPLEHPGKVLEPQYNDLVHAYQYAYDNFAEVSDTAYYQADQVHEEYDWDYLVEKQFMPIVSSL